MASDQAHLSFVIIPGTRAPEVFLNVHIVDDETGPVAGTSDLLPLAVVMLRYKIEAKRHPSLLTIAIDENQFDGMTDLFHTARNLLRNAMRAEPLVKIGRHFQRLQLWLTAPQRKGSKLVEVDAEHIQASNVSFRVITMRGTSIEPFTEGELLKLIAFLTGRCSAEEFFSEMNPGPSMMNEFKFGPASTKTTVVHPFRQGVPADAIKCSLTRQAFTVPEEINHLIDQAHRVLRTDTSAVRKMGDQPMLAPKQVEVSMLDLDSGSVQIEISFADSSYRHYAAFAFAEFLSELSADFIPLRDFARAVPDRYQPAPATCSMGVRVLVETSDRRLVVAHRSDQVKLNPNVWSVSANEGVRRKLLEPGRDCSDLLKMAVTKAIFNELRLSAEECGEPTLLSIYRNRFNQWGACFCVATELGADRVISRQSAADHAFEHRQIATLPLDIESCGRGMRELGERWYGGALESICQFLAWRELASRNFINPAKVGDDLSCAAEGLIEPVDEVNRALLPQEI